MNRHAARRTLSRRSDAEADGLAAYFSRPLPKCANPRCTHDLDDHDVFDGGRCEVKGCECRGFVRPQESAA